MPTRTTFVFCFSTAQTGFQIFYYLKKAVNLLAEGHTAYDTDSPLSSVSIPLPHKVFKPHSLYLNSLSRVSKVSQVNIVSKFFPKLTAGFLKSQ